MYQQENLGSNHFIQEDLGMKIVAGKEAIRQGKGVAQIWYPG